MSPRETGRNIGGRYSKYPGYRHDLGIMKFQDFLFEINDLPDRQLTDEELSAAMHEEHPFGKIIHADIREKRSVRVVRRAYNIGSHNHGPAKRQSWPYFVEGGKRVRRPYPPPYET